MARPLRINYPNAVYHVTARGNERKAIIRDDADRGRFVKILAAMMEQYQVICHAWVLMDNHYHLLLETPKANLSLAVRHLNGVYTQAFNRRHRRVGHLFQGRFKAIVIEKEAYLLELCRYVVLNPVRAGMVRHPRQWTWSSYRATSGEGEPASWLTVDWVLGQFGRTRAAAREAYQRFVEEGVKNPQSPWMKIRGQIYLGGDRFLEEMQRNTEREADLEIPNVQKRPMMPDVGTLLEKIARVYGVAIQHVVGPTWRPSEARQVGLYLARREAGLGLREIGERFGMGYTGVSRRVGAIEKRLKTDAQLRARVEAVLNANVKT